MTIERSGLAAGISPEPSALGMEILIALMEVQDTCDRKDGDRYRKRQIAAILRAVAASELFMQNDASDDPEFGQMIADAAAAMAVHVEEMERPNSRLEDDILMRLRAIPTEEALAERYHEPRDAKCVRRRGVLSAVLDAVSTNTFITEHYEDEVEFIIDPDDVDANNLADFSVARRDFHFDRERLDSGLKAAFCLATAVSGPTELIKPVTQRDALVWAMVAINTGVGHPVHKTHARLCKLAAQYTGLKAGTLAQYLKELRKGKAWQEEPKFSEEEHAIFKMRSERVIKLARSQGQGWDLVLPALKGFLDSALPKPSSVGQTHNARKVTSDGS